LRKSLVSTRLVVKGIVANAPKREHSEKPPDLNHQQAGRRIETHASCTSPDARDDATICLILWTPMLPSSVTKLSS
jgi:hypothetical protein